MSLICVLECIAIVPYSAFFPRIAAAQREAGGLQRWDNGSHRSCILQVQLSNWAAHDEYIE